MGAPLRREKKILEPVKKKKAKGTNQKKDPKTIISNLHEKGKPAEVGGGGGGDQDKKSATGQNSIPMADLLLLQRYLGKSPPAERTSTRNTDAGPKAKKKKEVNEDSTRKEGGAAGRATDQ